MNRAEKEQELQFLTDCFKKTKISLCADFRGLSVAQVTALRRDLRAVGSAARVVKNSLIRLGAERVLEGRREGDVAKFLDLLEGPTMLVYSYADPVAPTKVISKFAKDNEKLRVKGAFLDGAFVDPSGVTALSNMPGREEILSQLLRLINAPATNLVRLMQAPATQVVRVLDAHRENIEKR